MEKIRERFKQKSSCESVRLRKRSSMLYSTDHKHSVRLLISIILFSDGCLFLQVFVPRVFQALLAAYADVKLYNLVLRWESPDVARWTVIFQPKKTKLVILVLFMYYYLEFTVFMFTVFILTLVLEIFIRLSFFIISFYVKLIVFSIITLTLSVFLKWILVQWNFLKFNVLHNVAVFYGAHPWHWYFTQGLPVVLGRHLPLFLHGCSLATKKHRILVITVLWTTAIYILLAHKEFRFVYPVLPFCMIFSGMSLANLIPALYTGLIQQRGPLCSEKILKTSFKNIKNSNTSSSKRLVALMFCSHLHCPLNLRFLECPPDLTGNEEYVDEADVFFSNPLHWLRMSFPSQSTLPSHILLFDCLEKEISSFLEENRFAKKAEIFHTHFPEGRVGRNILIYTRGSELKTK
uniref:Mannosyltransferase n=1 Tax=Cyprinus carpio TaxID=7962 RepID=A0A8C1GJC0_CYPCA